MHGSTVQETEKISVCIAFLDLFNLLELGIAVGFV